MFYSRKRLSIKLIEQKGFTLIEMLVVVAIIGILTGIAVPNIANWAVRYRLKSATRNLVSNMIKAKSQAVTENASYKIEFNDVVGQDTYTISSGTTWWTIELSPGHPKIEYDTINFADNELIFLPNATVKGGGGDITLKNKNGETYTITVFLTGAMKVKK